MINVRAIYQFLGGSRYLGGIRDEIRDEIRGEICDRIYCTSRDSVVFCEIRNSCFCFTLKHHYFSTHYPLYHHAYRIKPCFGGYIPFAVFVVIFVVVSIIIFIIIGMRCAYARRRRRCFGATAQRW